MYAIRDVSGSSVTRRSTFVPANWAYRKCQIARRRVQSRWQFQPCRHACEPG